MVVVLSTITILDRSHRPVSGSPRPVPVAEPPSIGACLAADNNLHANQIFGWDDQAGPVTIHRYVRYPAATFSDCAAEHDGEVVGVQQAKPITVAVDPGTGETSVTDANVDWCSALASSAMGAADDLGEESRWHRWISAKWVLIGPDARQIAAQQSWVGCASVVTGDESLTVTPYQGTLRDAALTGAQHDQIGICGDDLDTQPEEDCRMPHTQEGFATRNVIGKESWRQAETSCAAEVRSVTGLPALSGATGLKVLVTASNSSVPDNESDPIPAESILSCLVATIQGKKLRGSLIALNEAPIPWA